MIRGPAAARRPSVLLIVIVVLGLGGCTKTTAAGGDGCGDGVVGANEDCDPRAPGAPSTCLPAGSAGECHLDCSLRPDGTRPACPIGWGCNPQDICRPPSGAFRVSGQLELPGLASLLAGDFDGDGRAELISLEPPDLAGRSHLRFHYVDDRGAPVETRPFPVPAASPAVADLSGDGRADLLFSSGGLGLVLGRADRSLVPEPFAAYRFPDASARMLAVADAPIQGARPLVAITAVAGVAGLFVPDAALGLRKRGETPVSADALAGEPVSADLFVDPLDSPCRELVLAARAATSFFVVSTCARASAAAPVTWRDSFQQQEVALLPAAAIESAPQVVDLDADGRLDVLLAAGGKTYAAFGDGRQLGPATPYRIRPASAPVAIDFPAPLAAGDLTGDGAVDFVFADHLLVSALAADGASRVYDVGNADPGAPWTVARIADLDGDGRPDLVAASAGRLGLDVLAGTGAPALAPVSLPTLGPVALLQIGDFDGDGARDAALVEPAASPGERDTLEIAFGSTTGPPAPPVPVARFDHAQGLAVARRAGGDDLVVSSAETSAANTTGAVAVLAGDGARLPFAPYALAGATALGLAVGAFSGRGGGGDVLVWASDGDPGAAAWSFWLLPSFASADRAAARLTTAVDPRLQPVSAGAYDVTVNLAAAAADLDGDGRDEALWATGADGDARCGLAVTGTTGTFPIVALVPRATLVIDEPCVHPQLLPADVDGDGAPDVVLLTGTPGLADRRLHVFWNDGAGQLAPTNQTVVSGDDAPEQFTVLPPTRGGHLTLAYVTAESVVLIEATGAVRGLGAPRALSASGGGRGIVAADFDGDGATDLAVATPSGLRVLAAALQRP